MRLDHESFFRVFWYFLIFDFPRYIFTDFIILTEQLLGVFNRRQNRDFLLSLQENPPLVSVIIPALNEEATIGWTIKSLQEQSYHNLEIIVVDDGSDDRTPTICLELQERHRDLQYRRFARRAGKSAALNYGLRFAQGDYVVFVDSDTTFDRDAIFRLMTAFADPNVGGVSGNLRVRNHGKNLLTRLQQIEYLFTISIGRRIRAEFDILPIISGAFGGFRKNIVSLEGLGGHEPGPGNDSDLAIRVRKKGYRIVFVPNANCLTNVPESPYKLLKQRSRWDRNIVRNRVRKHRDVFNPWSKNFRLKDAATFVDSIFFHIVLSFLTLFYLIDVSINYPQAMPALLLINFFLYFCAELIELVIATIFTNSPRDLGLAIYMPIFNPYKLILKVVRAAAYCQELLFRYSNRDPFAPLKVRRKMIQW